MNRRGATDLNPLFGYWMDKTQLPRVQKEVLKRKLLFKKDVLLIVSVLFVPDDVVADVREMASDLMSSAGK